MYFIPTNRNKMFVIMQSYVTEVAFIIDHFGTTSYTPCADKGGFIHRNYTDCKQ